MPDTLTADLILRELTAPKQRGVHYSPDSAAALLAEYSAALLAAAAARVAALPTANDGQLIAAYRDVVLNTITAAASVEG